VRKILRHHESYRSAIVSEVLDDEQQVVVDYNDSIVVVSGPGSGKTRILTEKARSLFNQGYNILCLTFTRAAAREMSNRVAALPATTIHSYCHGNVGWKDEWGYEGLLYRFLRSDDKTAFDWILVDECQDLNPLEFDVIQSLSGGKIFAVGDPYQSIYGFQEALGPVGIELLERLGCKRVDLHYNYRSCEDIVTRLNKIYDRQLISMAVKDTNTSCILFRTNEALFGISKFLKSLNISHKLYLGASQLQEKEVSVLGGNESLGLSTIHSAKGREFDNVVIYDWYPNDRGEELRVYYVACSRASKNLISIRNVDKLMKTLQDWQIIT